MNSPEIDGIGAGRIIRRKADGSCESATDEVAVEEPLEIRIDNKPIAVTMRTPGQDEELAAGFLLSEGIVRQREDLREIAPLVLPGSFGNIVNVALGTSANFNPIAVHRFGTISSSCGLCGKTSIEFIRQQFAPLPSKRTLVLKIEHLLQMPDRLRRGQKNFGRTGGIHAAGILDYNGSPIILREDVGRHNAVDKVIGRAFLDKLLPLRGHVLLVSGRTSLEIVQKALAAGIPIVASVSAPSTLAINFAREVGQTLIGFLRPPIFNIYSHIERLRLSESD
jgi:FdhD protein